MRWSGEKRGKAFLCEKKQCSVSFNAVRALKIVVALKHSLKTHSDKNSVSDDARRGVIIRRE